MIGPGQSRIHPMLYLLIGALGILTFFIVAPLWSFIFGGLLVGYLGHPLFERVHARVKRRDLCALIALLALLVIILVPAGYLGYELVLQTQDLAQGFTAEDARTLLESVAGWTSRYLGWPQVPDGQTTAQAVLDEIVPRARAAVLAWLPTAATFLAEFALGVTVVLFIGYYALRDGDRLVHFVEDVLPLTPATEQRIIEDVRNALDAVVFGQVLTAVIQGILAGIGFFLFGIPAPVLWGFLSAVLSLIPVIGPPLIWAPAGVFLIARGEVGSGIGLLVWGAVIVSTLDNVIKPKIMSERSGMHPTLALLGVVGGLIAFGFMGFLLGPVVLALFLTLVRIYMEQRAEGEVPQHPAAPLRNNVTPTTREGDDEATAGRARGTEPGGDAGEGDDADGVDTGGTGAGGAGDGDAGAVDDEGPA